jgi:hypothetical protein
MTNTLAAAIRTALSTTTGTPQDGIALDALALLAELEHSGGNLQDGIEHGVRATHTPTCL